MGTHVHLHVDRHVCTHGDTLVDAHMHAHEDGHVRAYRDMHVHMHSCSFGTVSVGSECGVLCHCYSSASVSRLVLGCHHVY